MDCYHDILGTTPNSSEQEIKRQYKLLSNRVHPDKGGNPALMMLINRAYEKVVSGSGVQDVYSSSSADAETVMQTQSMHKLLIKLKHENSKLQQENLKYATQQQKMDSGNTPDSKALQQKLNQANQELMKTRISLSEAEKQILTFKNSQNQLHKHANKPASPSRVKLIAVITIILLSLVVGVNWYQQIESNVITFIRSLINEPVIEKQVDTIKPQQIPEASSSHQTYSDEFDAVPEAEALNIMASQSSGQWQLRYYMNSFIPYIAIKNEQGSLIVSNCEADFFYYHHRPTRPLRVAANLEYIRPEGGRFVYHILYGNGASVQSWQKSKLLRFDQDSFKNTQFTEALNQLKVQCAAITPEL